MKCTNQLRSSTRRHDVVQITQGGRQTTANLRHQAPEPSWRRGQPHWGGRILIGADSRHRECGQLPGFLVKWHLIKSVSEVQTAEDRRFQPGHVVDGFVHRQARVIMRHQLFINPPEVDYSSELPVLRRDAEDRAVGRLVPKRACATAVPVWRPRTSGRPPPGPDRPP